jgi:hypothetical protein
MNEFIPDKKLLVDKMGRPLTQALFLEVNYNPESAVYTRKDYDHEYKGKVYPSLKRLYLQMEDVVEYEFANTAVADIISMTAEEKSFQAAKWLADKGWDKRRAGRPSKDEVEQEKKMQASLEEEYGSDVKRLFKKR